MDSWLKLPTSDKNKLAERELSAGLNSLKLFKLDDASKHFEGTLFFFFNLDERER